MPNRKALNTLRPSERECSLEEALNSTLSTNKFYMWVASGNKVFEDLPHDDYESMSIVMPSIAFEGHYTVCAVVYGERHHSEKAYSKAELKKEFPSLFSVIGQLISTSSY